MTRIEDNSDISRLFVELIKVSLGHQGCLNRNPSEEEWGQLYEKAHQQALLGICFAGLKNLEKSGQRPPSEVFFQWLAIAAQIQERYEQMNDYQNKAIKLLCDYGFACFVLKGQSVAKCYGPLASLRQSGDIDIWVKEQRDCICKFSIETLGYVNGITYKHMSFPYWKDVDVEIHFRPGYLNNPVKNIRLQRYFKKFAPEDKTNLETDAPWKFNAIFLLLHCFSHFLERGIGMRQLMDYYYFLIKYNEDIMSVGVNTWEKVLHNLGLLQFAKSTMWVLEYLFGLDRKYMIVNPTEKGGMFLLNEVLQTGNFGQRDQRYNWNLKTPLKRFIANQHWNLHLLKHYPSEIIWSPFAAIYRYAQVKQWKWQYRHSQSSSHELKQTK